LIPVQIITDCFDGNAAMRQSLRLASFGFQPLPVVPVGSDLEAAGQLIDALDASLGRPSVIIANVAPRHGQAKKWPNGTPFGYFYRDQTLVVATIDGLTLSLVKKLQLVETYNQLDLPQVIEAMVQCGKLSSAEGQRLVKTQFRSFEFATRVSYWLFQGIELASTIVSLAEVSEAPKGIWWEDNFGNLKTTLKPDEVNGHQYVNDIPFILHSRLKDVPDKELALVEGSSGIGNQRLMELVVQGGSAATKLNLQAGSLIELS